jgi:anti-anti-sigma regulatory factor
MLHVQSDGRGAVVVELHEPPLAHDLSRLRSHLAQSLMRGPGEVTVDLSTVDRISSPTVAALLWARRSCATRGVPFRVTGTTGQNAKVLRLCGLVTADAGGGSSW